MALSEQVHFKLDRFLVDENVRFSGVGVRYPLTARDFPSDVVALAFMQRAKGK